MDPQAERCVRRPFGAGSHAAGRAYRSFRAARLSGCRAGRLVSVPPTTVRIRWKTSHRIIRTIYPPVHLFEDIADPADWDLIARAEARTNPRIHDEIGNLALVPPERRVSGPTASLVMGAFTHVSRDRP